MTDRRLTHRPTYYLEVEWIAACKRMMGEVLEEKRPTIRTVTALSRAALRAADVELDGVAVWGCKRGSDCKMLNVGPS